MLKLEDLLNSLTTSSNLSTNAANFIFLSEVACCPHPNDTENGFPKQCAPVIPLGFAAVCAAHRLLPEQMPPELWLLAHKSESGTEIHSLVSTIL